jgi:hypothetical protein
MMIATSTTQHGMLLKDMTKKTKKTKKGAAVAAATMADKLTVRDDQ